MTLSSLTIWASAGFLLTLLVIRQRTNILRILDLFSVLSEGKEWSSRLKTPEGVLDYIKEHPLDVSLVAYKIDDVENGIFYNPDTKYPLASTIKILVLAEYARQVEKNLLSPDELVDLSEVEIYYLPRTDGNAHPEAVKEWSEKGYIQNNQIALRQITRAMIRYSDNAATDYLIIRLGRKELQKLVSELNIPDQDVPLPIIGQVLTWSNHQFTDTFTERLTKYQGMTREAYADEVYRLTKIWCKDKKFRDDEIEYINSELWLKIKEQQAMAQALNCGGTARGYAEIMSRIYTNKLVSPRADEIMREYLEWAMEFSNNQQELDAFGSKGGSLAGIITEAWYIKPKDANQARVMALFFNNLPSGVWFGMVQSYVQQDFGYKLLLDEEFFNLVYQRLVSGSVVEK